MHINIVLTVEKIWSIFQLNSRFSRATRYGRRTDCGFDWFSQHPQLALYMDLAYNNIAIEHLHLLPSFFSLTHSSNRSTEPPRAPNPANNPALEEALEHLLLPFPITDADCQVFQDCYHSITDEALEFIRQNQTESLSELHVQEGIMMTQRELLLSVQNLQLPSSPSFIQKHFALARQLSIVQTNIKLCLFLIETEILRRKLPHTTGNKKQQSPVN